MRKAALQKMDKVFPPGLLRRGALYCEQGHVMNLRLSEGLLKAQVKGEPGQIFLVYLDLKSWPGQPARCNCSSGGNCVHAAACLLALAQQESRKESASDKPERDTGFTIESQSVSEDRVEWFSEVNPTKSDYFDYQLGILVNGQRVNIVPLVIDLIQRFDERTLMSLSDDVVFNLPILSGKSLKLSVGRIKPLLYFLLQYSKAELAKLNHLRIKRFQLLLLLEAEQALQASRARWHGTDQLRAKLEVLANVGRMPMVSAPTGLQTDLRDYQRMGLAWLQCLRQSGFGGILADDMGLGKTIQALSNLLLEKEAGRLKRASLIVAPTSLLGNWLAEAARFTPSLRVLVFHGSVRHADEFDEYDVVVTTYGLIQRDKKRFIKYPFYYLILDEAQSIKNARNKTTLVVQQLRAEHRLCLTGTPLENHLGELWSLFHFLMPGFLGPTRVFRQQIKTPIEKHQHEETRQWLMQRIKPFLLRRTKEEVLTELPPKTQMVRTIELSGAQRDLYESIRLSLEKKVREAIAAQGLGNSQVVFLDALLKLRQVCCDPRLVSLPQAEMAHGESAKLQTLLELLDGLMDEGRHVLVFSQFTSMLHLIEEALRERGYAYLKLTGQTKNRTELVEQFQQGAAPIFLISLKAGGVGLNLTKADTVIHYDPWWNPAVEDQATDRSHRIGQDKPVFVYKLIASGSVEDVMMTMQERKRQLVAGVLANSNAGLTAWTEEDIEAFFQAPGGGGRIR